MWIDSSPLLLLFTLLVAGHLAGDFLLQSDAMVQRKGEEWRPLVLHGLCVMLAQLFLAWPFVDLWFLPAVLLLVLLHLLLDRTKIALASREGVGELRSFVAEQLLHLLLLALFVLAWGYGHAASLGTTHLPAPALLRGYTTVVLICSGYIVNTTLASAIVSGILARFAHLWPESAAATVDAAPGLARNAMGRTIGVLERQIVYTLILLGQWGALGLVLAAKSVARYPEMKQRHFADYYLIGTLASLCVALASGVVVALLIGQLK
jgi:hypothetical protein